MKNKRFLIVAIVGLALLLIVFAIVKHSLIRKPSLSVKKIAGNGLYVGDRAMQAPSQVLDTSMNSDKVDRAIDDAWKNIELGNIYLKDAQYEKAAEAFKKAYFGGYVGGKAMGGFKLAEAYEKLHQYDEAITHLNRMIQNHELSELGIQDAKEMIARLQAAKSTNA